MMKKLISALISAALIAAPMALISTPASAKTKSHVTHAKKAKATKVKASAKSGLKAKSKAKGKIKTKGKVKHKTKPIATKA